MIPRRGAHHQTSHKLRKHCLVGSHIQEEFWPVPDLFKYCIQRSC